MSTEYLNAGDARKLADDAVSLNSAYLRDVMEKVMKTITDRAAVGETCATFGTAEPVIVTRLKQLHYEVTVTQDQRDGPWMRVNW